MKKIFPYLLAVIVFLAALVLLRPAASRTVVVAAADLPSGHTLAEADLSLLAMPANAVASDALTKLDQAVGQTLRLDRGQGDILRASNLGDMIALQPDERAVAVKVSDATGLAGLLTPGQRVGIVATVQSQEMSGQGTFSKAAIEGLKVMYIDPRFAAASEAGLQPVGTPASSGSLSSVGGVNTASERAQTGFVVLAVPTSLQAILYDFTADHTSSASRSVNVLELLAALGTTDGADITLYLMPAENAADFASPGLWLPDLVVTPGPTFTPTPE